MSDCDDSLRSIEIKELHSSNARHKAAVKSNQKKFHAMQEHINELRRENFTLTSALLDISDACFDHECHGEGDAPDCPECIAVSALCAALGPTKRQGRSND